MSRQTITETPVSEPLTITSLLAIALAPFTALLPTFGKVAVTWQSVTDTVRPLFDLSASVRESLDKVLAVMLARFYTDNPFSKRGYKANKAKLYKAFGVDDAHSSKATLDRIFSNYASCHSSKLPEVIQAVAEWARGEYVTPLQTAYSLVLTARAAERDAKEAEEASEAETAEPGAFSPMSEADIVRHILAHNAEVQERIIQTIRTALDAAKLAAKVDAK